MLYIVWRCACVYPENCNFEYKISKRKRQNKTLFLKIFFQFTEKGTSWWAT